LALLKMTKAALNSGIWKRISVDCRKKPITKAGGEKKGGAREWINSLE
jgi:hypothetical protein